MEGFGFGNLKLNNDSDDASCGKDSSRKATMFVICTIASGFGDTNGNHFFL